MIEINNLTNFAVDKKFLTGVVKIVLKGENKEKENISIAFIRKDEIKNLNKKYRKIDKATDALAFGENPKSLSALNSLGEIVICPEVVKENGEESAKVLIHGILHLLGYDHEKNKTEAKKMKEKEEHYLLKINRN
ncbi:MAG: putative rRNA maturation factor [Parcubacteria group bacterium Licking1014_1]|nr:MAG: putative rRNA maturation factor [Parcubacteria group bacterium Licking1014_1]